MVNSGGKFNRSKIIISLPNFWLEYLNEQIESDVWEDYSEAILNTIRYYFRSQKSIQETDSKYLESAKEILPSLVNFNPNIESMLLSSSSEVLYKTEQWESTEGILNLIRIWEKGAHWHQNWKNKWKKGAHLREDWIMQDPEEEMAKTKNIRSFEFQNETYSVRDISVKHLIAVKKDISPSSPFSRYLLGLKRKLTETDVYIFAIAKDIEDSASILIAINALKRAAMGSLPPISEEPRDKPFQVLKFPKDFPRKSDADLRKIWLEEQRKSFQIKMNPTLMQLARQVNILLKPEEEELINALEKQIGRNIERITADPEEKTNKREMFICPGFVQMRSSLLLNIPVITWL